MELPPAIYWKKICYAQRSKGTTKKGFPSVPDVQNRPIRTFNFLLMNVFYVQTACPWTGVVTVKIGIWQGSANTTSEYEAFTHRKSETWIENSHTRKNKTEPEIKILLIDLNFRTPKKYVAWWKNVQKNDIETSCYAFILVLNLKGIVGSIKPSEIRFNAL